MEFPLVGSMFPMRGHRQSSPRSRERREALIERYLHVSACLGTFPANSTDHDTGALKISQDRDTDALHNSPRTFKRLMNTWELLTGEVPLRSSLELSVRWR